MHGLSTKPLVCISKPKTLLVPPILRFPGCKALTGLQLWIKCKSEEHTDLRHAAFLPNHIHTKNVNINTIFIRI